MGLFVQSVYTVNGWLLSNEFAIYRGAVHFHSIVFFQRKILRLMAVDGGILDNDARICHI